MISTKQKSLKPGLPVKNNTNIPGVCLRVFLPIALSLCLLSFMLPPDQENPLLKKWPPSTVNSCREKSNVPYLTNEEKNTHFFINLARANPRLFYDTFVSSLKDSLLIKDKKYLNTLKTDMYNAQAMPLLEADIFLYETAKEHATQMGKSGKTGHSNVAGIPYYERVNQISKKYSKLLESCQYGYSRGLFVMLDLLIDDGVVNLGHRRALLDKEALYIGVSMQTHKKYKMNTVIEMAHEKI